MTRKKAVRNMPVVHFFVCGADGFSFHHFLHKGPKFLFHYWLVLALVYFAVIPKMSVVEGIGEDKGRAGNVDSLSIFCNEVVALKIFSDTLQCLVAFRVQP